MIFSNPQFILYLVSFLSIYELIGRTQFRSYFLVVSSLLFYLIFAGVAALFILIFAALTTWICLKSVKVKLIPVGIFANIFLLFSFKYLHTNSLFISAHDYLLSFLSLNDIQDLIPKWIEFLIIPLGLSFYVFELIHLLIEKFRGGITRLSLSEYLNFIFFWPTVIAGPIKRLKGFKVPDLSDLPLVTRLYSSVPLVALGYFYKVIGDNLAILIRVLEGNLNSISPNQARLLILILGLRIFFDFAGYSYIAIGISRQIGVYLPRNFHAPYLALNIRDFWNRWHISLSSWIRDYVYVPLGGNRNGAARKRINLLAAMTLCGAWHGGTSNFVLWGAYHGILLASYDWFRSWKRVSKNQLSSKNKFQLILRFRESIGWILTQILVFLGWTLFFYPIKDALEILKVAI
jgi:alginate O-acetyltransferase complex protein AlgI